ncbi:MAG TPA: hypothetical protein VLG11_06250 [Candidatus Saccharimonadales bacterium]|nr:hypothetical protein [Candidatus Saccharimonadales bacterium]
MVMTMLRNKHRPHDPVWHVQLAMLFTIGLQLLLPNIFSFGGRYVTPVLELILLGALSLTTPPERVFKSLVRRVNALLLIAITSLTNTYALAMVVQRLLAHSSITSGRTLILASINIYLTNIVIFALWYWEMDGGGPGERQRIEPYEQDFMFPQHINKDYKHPEWRPTFVDYLYVSSTNAMAFSPTDTLPLSRRAKMLMLLQAAISLITIALVAARAVNILN